MNAAGIDGDAVRWAVGGHEVPADAALSALSERPLLIMLHGFGSFEGDLIALAPRLPHEFVCASPRAPLVAPSPIVNGFSWWPLSVSADGRVQQDADPSLFISSPPEQAAQAVLTWLDSLDSVVRNAGRSSGIDSVAVMGFSQGGCLVTSLLRLAPKRFICGVNCSGFVAPGYFEGDAALVALRPPMFWGHDPEDPIIGSARVAALSKWARSHTELEHKIYHGVAHGIAPEEVNDISAFLVRNLAMAVTA